MDKILKRIVDLLSKDKDINKIIVFGSYLKNKEKASDIDLLIEGNFKGRIIERRMRIYDILDEIHGKIAIDIIPLTQSEINELLKKGSIFIGEILKEGKVVYERNN